MDELAIHDARKWGYRVFWIVMGVWIFTSLFCGCIPFWDVPKPPF